MTILRHLQSKYKHILTQRIFCNYYTHCTSTMPVCVLFPFPVRPVILQGFLSMSDSHLSSAGRGINDGHEGNIISKRENINYRMQKC